jgi:Spy/CpxP family protein refolding chaperone
MTRRATLIVLIVAAVATSAAAQRGGRGGGGGGDAGGGPMTMEFSRLETLTQSFKLTKDQKDKVKELFDEAQKNAAPMREGLAGTRTAISTAIQGGKSQADVDAAVKDYAAQATAMTALEMKALGRMLQLLDKEQGANAAAVQNAFFMIRGMFLSKKWDIIPSGSYRY